MRALYSTGSGVESAVDAKERMVRLCNVNVIGCLRKSVREDVFDVQGTFELHECSGENVG